MRTLMLGGAFVVLGHVAAPAQTMSSPFAITYVNPADDPSRVSDAK